MRIAVCASQFEVPVVGCEPCVDHRRDVDVTVSKNERAWNLLAAVAGVALDTHAEQPPLRHRMIIEAITLSQPVIAPSYHRYPYEPTGNAV